MQGLREGVLSHRARVGTEVGFTLSSQRRVAPMGAREHPCQPANVLARTSPSLFLILQQGYTWRKQGTATGT